MTRHTRMLRPSAFRMGLVPVAVLAAVLAGCAVPPVTVNAIPAQPVPTATASIEPAPDWWKRFGDARIDALIDEALASNRDLARAMARIDEARAALRGAQAERAPVVTANASAARARASENGTIPGGGTGNLFDASLSVRHELDLWGRLASASQAAREELLATEYAREVLRTALTAQVVQAYAALQSLDAQVRTYERVLASQREGLRLQGLRLQAGELAELDYRQLEAEVTTSELQLPKLRRAQGETQRALGLLLGRSPRALWEEPVARAETAATGAMPVSVPDGLPSNLLLRRPDVQASEARLRAAGARVDAARAAYFPDVGLSAGLGLESTSLSRLIDGPSLIWSAAASLTQPLWNGGRLDAQYQAAQARRLQLELDYRDSVAAAFKEARDALAAQEEAQTSLAGTRLRAQTLRRAAELTRLRTEGGEASRLQLLDAERLALLAELQTHEALRAVVAAQAELFRALGGGWQRPVPGTAANRSGM